MRARIVGVAFGGLLATLGCSFPDIQFSTEGTGGAGGSTGGTGGAAGTMMGSSGATTTTTTTTGSGGSACCDCDGDKHDAVVCGGDDCDDHDPKAFGGEPTFYADMSSNSSVGFDWDCDHKVTQDPTLTVKLDCKAQVTQAKCVTDMEGFLDNVIPGCGAAGDWGKCVWNGIALPPCDNQVIQAARPMLCK